MLTAIYRQAEAYERRHGRADTVRLDCERGMPRSNATGEEWEAYHQAMLTGRAAPLPDVPTEDDGCISLDALLAQEERGGE